MTNSDKLYIVCYLRGDGSWDTAAEGCYSDYNVAAMHVELKKARHSPLSYFIFEAVPAGRPALSSEPVELDPRHDALDGHCYEGCVCSEQEATHPIPEKRLPEPEPELAMGRRA